ncbi:AbrB/MazE/SpoVT family DNA-binding domain-containing protein [Aquisalimonas sp.]|uniref:antitoxin n=1 Tax=Aquisalimonas sp. TaxID=1872621 RepID=UPI0025C26B7F|nr:AbrB/MazE/SpoVT family DNA-binding domain-containing protein [Aquisalimonas sp.]
MSAERHIRIFRNGRNQAIRIPREFALDAREVTIRREGDRLIIEPVRPRGLLATLSTLPDLDETLPDTDAGLLPLDDVDL